MKKYNLFIVGCAKSGSSFLRDYLNLHPDISFSSIKEPNYFGENGEFSSEEYHGLIDDPSATFFGDATVEYIQNESSLKNIKKYNESSKIIVVLRDPVTRAWSHYWHRVKNGEEIRSVEDLCKLEPDEFVKEYFVTYSQFGAGIRRIQRVFGENYQVTYQSDLKNKGQILESLDRITDYLGLRSFSDAVDSDVSFVRKNESAMYKNRMVSRAHYILQRNKGRIKKVVPFLNDGTWKSLSQKVRSMNRKKWEYPEIDQEFRSKLIDSLREDMTLYEKYNIRDMLIKDYVGG